MTLEQVAKNHGLTLDQAKQLKGAMQNTWEYVGGDFVECCGGEDEALQIFDSYAEMVAEATVDAGRLRAHSGSDVDWFYAIKADILKIATEVYGAGGW